MTGEEGGSLLLDVRIYRLQPGRAEVFDSLVRGETVPLARSFGHQIVAFGPSLEDDGVYYLIRAFPAADDRREALDRLYGSREWQEQYDDRVAELFVSYETAVFPAPAAVVGAWGGTDPGRVRSS